MIYGKRKIYPPEEKRHLYYAFIQIGKEAHHAKVELRDKGEINLTSKIRRLEKHMKTIRSFNTDKLKMTLEEVCEFWRIKESEVDFVTSQFEKKSWWRNRRTMELIEYGEEV
jgi:hypothetical protein